MNAETGTEPEAPKKRGRIPQSAWPQILERYRSGATLSAIAREFECTPSAISYIIRKAEAAGGAGEDTAEAPAESAAAEAPVSEAPVTQPPAVEPQEAASAVAESSAPPAVKPAARAERRPKAVAEAPKPEVRASVPPAAAAQPAAPQVEERRAAPQQTETLRLNRPDPQPVAQLAPEPVQPAAAATPSAAPVAAGEAPRTGSNPPPVDAVEARLRDTARGCLAAYRGWRQQPGEDSIQALSDAVHELRKALARIEIDMSASRREEQAIRPIPIPAHRTARRTP
ncbi:helix-turn-helix domain-containing protein [Azospirillum canadense]|uniref:helix-turn-helix domain-containing protein n=1 Tax=Azospirillum canadense TaxID=403962 RepID=UPI002227B50C|nr:helix-turn-helix domain-containing protein [Azospirillum canadense]MCW2236951.1 transposase-like protein [Azospirillum canadense]